MYPWPRKSSLNFESHPDLDQDLGIFLLWDRGNAEYFAGNQRNSQLITLHAISDAVYYNRSCLFVAGLRACVCLWVGLLIR